MVINRGHWCSFRAEQLQSYEQVADHPGDRTYGNYVRSFIRNDFADPFGGA